MSKKVLIMLAAIIVLALAAFALSNQKSYAPTTNEPTTEVR